MKTSFSLLLLIIFFSCNQTDNKTPMTTDNDMHDYVNNLLSQMTLEEKIGQLNQYSVGGNLTGPGEKNENERRRINQLKNGEIGSVLNLLGAKEGLKMQKMVVENSRLGIPLIFAFDVIHGYKTMFPIPLAETSSWDLEAIEESAKISAREAASAGIQWTFAPMVDVSRDARWGRVMEGAGEDPYLGSLVAKARVNGFQGNNLADTSTIAACAKHFAGYGFVESGKDYNNVYVGNNLLHNMIMPPFKAAVDANVATFMNAFNDIDGIPSTAHKEILRGILKGNWEYDGVVVSDWNSVGEIVTHGTAKDLSEATKLAINAGCDIDMEADAYATKLIDLVNNDEVPMSVIDDATKRVLELKYKLGLFQDPYKYFNETREKNELLSKKNLDEAENIARKSIVLLKNENNLLPLNPTSSIALIGPLATDKDTPLGNWRGAAHANSAISLKEGLEERLGITIPTANGCNLSIGSNTFHEKLQINETDRSGFQQAIALAKKSEVVIMALGETAYMSGEGRSRSEIGLPGLQLELLKEIYKVNKNIVLVLMNGRPLTIPWEAENIPAIIEAWHLGSRAGYAIADVLLANYNPSGKLPMSFPRSNGQLPIYYNHKTTGRPTAPNNMVFYVRHMDVDNSPLYPFGYGLSYSNFEYSNMKLSAEKIKVNEKLVVTVEVENTSDLDGEEVVQLYIRDMVSSMTRPVLELKGFKKIMIKAKEKVEVSFTLESKDLSFYTANKIFEAEKGEFKVFLGTNSNELESKVFELVD